MELACFEPCAVGTCFAPDSNPRLSLSLAHVKFYVIIDMIDSKHWT
jgi:hypothetical protein